MVYPVNKDNSHTDKNSKRIFFALWPEQDVREALNKNTKSDITSFLKEKPLRKVPMHNWHFTLAFVGNVSAEIFACCLEQGSQISAEAFSLTLNKFNYFEQSKVIWIGCDQIPTAWYELVNKLNQALLLCGYKLDKTHPIPHMTVLRKAKQPMAVTQFDPVTWTASEFALIESTTTDNGVLYSAIKCWPLR